MFSKQLGIKYSSFDHIVVSVCVCASKQCYLPSWYLSISHAHTHTHTLQIGLGWQSLILVYHQPSTPDFNGAGRERSLQKFILITGNEAVSRSLFHSIRDAAAKCPGFMRHIPLNRDDESRTEAIEKELITKLGSNVRLL